MFKAVCFDFNGTLIEDQWLWCESVRAVCCANNVRLPGDEEILKGLLNIRSDAELIAMYRSFGVIESAEAIRIVYKNHYALHAGRCRVYPDVREILEWLVGHGVLVFLLTANTMKETGALLRLLDLARYFSMMVYRASDKAMYLRVIAKACGIAPQEMCMVGDTRSDIIHARAAGCFPIAIVRGHYSKEDVLAHPEDHPIESLRELLPFFQ